jgi:hypothetical protein
MSEEIEVEISPSGQVTIRTLGVQGPKCVEMTEEIARVVGIEVSRVLTPAFYETTNAPRINQSIGTKASSE